MVRRHLQCRDGMQRPAWLTAGAHLPWYTLGSLAAAQLSKGGAAMPTSLSFAAAAPLTTRGPPSSSCTGLGQDGEAGVRPPAPGWRGQTEFQCEFTHPAAPHRSVCDGGRGTQLSLSTQRHSVKPVPHRLEVGSPGGSTWGGACCAHGSDVPR